MPTAQFSNSKNKTVLIFIISFGANFPELLNFLRHFDWKFMTEVINDTFILFLTVTTSDKSVNKHSLLFLIFFVDDIFIVTGRLE